MSGEHGAMGVNSIQSPPAYHSPGAVGNQYPGHVTMYPNSHPMRPMTVAPPQDKRKCLCLYVHFF